MSVNDIDRNVAVKKASGLNGIGVNSDNNVYSEGMKDENETIIRHFPRHVSA